MTKPRRLDIVQMMDSPRLFARSFHDRAGTPAASCWDLWRTILRAAFALPMTDEQLAAFRAIAEREPPSRRVDELVAIVGRGGGKDSIASLIATVLAIDFDPRGKLRPGEKAVIMLLAVDRTQAEIVRGYIRAYFEEIPALKAKVKSLGDIIELHNGVSIEVHTNSYRAVRGRSILCAIFDECAFWRDENYANPADEVYGAVTPGLARVPGSMLIIISTAHTKSGLLYTKYTDHYGKPDDSTLVVKGTTFDFNPESDRAKIEQQIAKDPELNGAEYLSIWRTDISAFIDRAVVDSITAYGRHEIEPMLHTTYAGFCDPSGGSSDSFTIAIAHKDQDNKGILDLVREWRSPFDPTAVIEEAAAIFRSYKISTISGDSFAGAIYPTMFGKVFIIYEKSDRSASAIYLDTLPLINSGRVELLDNSRLISQLLALERRTSRSAPDRIDHPKNAHDDLINAACGALLKVAGQASPADVWKKLGQQARQEQGGVRNASAAGFQRDLNARRNGFGFIR